jgi:serine-type D-Ala-D-Ala carboxypeptidase (penicillin-binding protein 5/6)
VTTRPAGRVPGAALGSLLLVLIALGTAPAAAAHGHEGHDGEPATPDVSSPSAILMEASTLDVGYEKRADGRRPMASTAKLMTALVAARRADLDDVLTAPAYQGAPAETRVDLRPGERMTVRDLLRALLLPSANDAAVALAEGVSGSRAAFVREMNAEARRLGLRGTRFANPVGLDDPRGHSTARDLARLALAVRREPFLARTTDLPAVTLRSGDRSRRVVNRNGLVRRVDWVDGVKTGQTSGGGYILIGSGTRDGVTTVSVVMGAGSDEARQRDALALLRHGFRLYDRRALVRRDEALAIAGVRHLDDDQATLVAARGLTRVVRRGREPRVSVQAPEELEGPLPAGARVGTVVVRERGGPEVRVPLVTRHPVRGASLLDRMPLPVLAPLTAAVLTLIVGAGVPLARRRRRRAGQGPGGRAEDRTAA